MLIRQLFDYETYTYTYLVADSASGEAALIDPVVSQTDNYLQLLKELKLSLTLALDTHIHADHITALGALREKTGCATYVGNAGDVGCSDHALQDGLTLPVGSLNLNVIYTPGHTNDSYSFYLNENGSKMVFTGDTLFIRGTGRTDFQNGSAEKLFNSLHEKLLSLADETIVYPGHDYRGNTTSTIGEERVNNPRLLIENKDDFIEFMNNLNLPDPKYMDVAVPANLQCGKESLGAL